MMAESEPGLRPRDNYGGASPNTNPNELNLVEGLWTGDWWDWCRVILGGKIVPGLATIDVDVSRKIDVKSPNGADGASITDRGYQPAKIRISTVMWLEEHRLGLIELLKTIANRNKKTAKSAIDISCAQVEFHGIKSVYIESIRGPRVGRIQGTKELEIACIEFWRQTPAKKSVTQSIETSTDHSLQPKFRLDNGDHTDWKEWVQSRAPSKLPRSP